MTTTGLVAELIVVGLQALMWIGVLLMASFGDEVVISKVTAMASAEAVFAIVLLAGAYTLGVILDRMYLLAVLGLGIEKFFCQNRWVRAKAEPKMSPQFLQIYHATNNLDTFYYYVIRRTRMSCATFFNMVVLAASMVIAYLIRPAMFRTAGTFIGILAAVVVFASLALLAYGTLALAMTQRGEKILELRGSREPQKSREEPKE